MKKISRGFTLLEMMVAMSILAIIITAVFAIASEGQKGFDQDIIQSNLQYHARKAIESLTKDLTNSSTKQVDTAYRSWDRNANNFSQRNHFLFTVVSPRPARECLNSKCYWSTRVGAGGVDLGPQIPKAYVAYHWEQFRAGASNTMNLVKCGKAFGESNLTKCPYCGSALALTTIHLDGVKMMSPLDLSGTNIYLEGDDRKADWQAIIFYAPVQLTPGALELRRAVVYISDLFNPVIPSRVESNVSGPYPTFANPLYAIAGNTLATGGAGWTQWNLNNPPGKPTMYNLMDYDNDGQIEVDCASSDADIEVFQTIGNTVYFRKANATRNFEITINMLTGQTNWKVSISVAGQSWSREANFKRLTTACGTYLSGLDISTSASNPYNAVTNPIGLSDPNLVRVVVSYDRARLDMGAERHVETIVETAVTPRHNH